MNTFKATIAFAVLALFALFGDSSMAAYARHDVNNSGDTFLVPFRIKPGSEHTNGDGVKVTNDKDSQGNATIDPKDGDADSETNVDTKTKFKGSVENLDSNDSVTLGSSSTAKVIGTGGTVTLAGNSHVTVTNNGTSGSITVALPSGATLQVSAGSTVVIHT